MKKYLLFLIFLLGGLSTAYSQNYYNLNWIYTRGGNNPLVNQMSIDVEKADGTIENIIAFMEVRQSGGTTSGRISINSSSKIVNIRASIAFSTQNFSSNCSNQETYALDNCGAGINLLCSNGNNFGTPSVASITGRITTVEILPPSNVDAATECDDIIVPIETSCPNALRVDEWVYTLEDGTGGTLVGHEGENPLVFQAFELSPNPIDYLNRPITLEATFVTHPISQTRSITIIGCSPELIEGEIAVTNETCFGANDGSVTLTFDSNVDVVNGFEMRYFVYQGTPPDPEDPELISENPEFPGVDQQTIADPFVDLISVGGGNFEGKLDGLEGGNESGGNSATYFIIYQEVLFDDDLNVTVKSGRITPNFTINRPSQITVSIPDNNITQPQCFGDTGSVTVDGRGGGFAPDTNADLQYGIQGDDESWQPSATFSGLEAGNYIFLARTLDNDECISSPSQQVTITVPTELSFSEAMPGGATSNMINDGVISIEFVGGTPGYTFELLKENTLDAFGIVNDPDIDMTIIDNRIEYSNLGVGTYRISIQDANNCSLTSTDIAVIIIPTPMLNVLSVTPISCNNTNDATITVNATYIEATTFTYELRDSPTAPANIIKSGTEDSLNPPFSENIVISNVANGTYWLFVRASAGDFSSILIPEIVNPDPITVSITAVPFSCFDSTNGALIVTASGATNYEYELSTNRGDWLELDQNTILVTNPNSYEVTLRDRDNRSCVSTISNSVVVERPTPFVIDEDITNVSINNGSDGAISINTVNGGALGNPNYTFNWTADLVNGTDFNPETTQNIENLFAGNYFVEVAVSTECKQTFGPFRVNQPAPLSIDEITGTNSCNDLETGTLTATVQGTGNITFEFLLNPGPSETVVSTITTTDRTVTISNLAAGTYGLRITEEDSGNEDLTPSQDFVIITELARIEATITKTNATCDSPNSGSITVSATGGSPFTTGPNAATGYEYRINDNFNTFQPEANFDGLNPDVYTVTIRDALGCEYTENVTVDPGELPNIDLTNSGATSPTAIDDNDGFITLNFTNTDITGFTYEWNGPGTTNVTTQNLTNIEAGIYSVVITGEPGCSITRSFNVPVPDPQDIVPTVTTIDCEGNATGAIDVTIIGELPNSYQWTFADNSAITTSNGTIAEDISGLVAGTYVLTITYADNSTFRSRDIEITEPTAITAEPLTITNVACNDGNDGSITITASGGTGVLEYSLDGVTFQTDNTFSNLIADTYTITVSDVNGCAFQTTGTVDEPTIISISDPVTTNITSSGGADGAISFSVTGSSGNYTYTWLKDNQPFTPPTGSTDTSLIGLQAGVYDLTVSDSANLNCSITLAPSITLIEPGPLSIDSLIPTAILCKGEATGSITATVTGDGPFIYIWERVDNQVITSVNSSTISGLSAGEYRLRVTDQSTNPEITDTVTIDEPALDVTAIITPTDTSCFGANDGSISINASGGTAGYTYSLDGVAFQTNNTFSDLIADTYTITVRDVNDCEFQTTGTVDEPTIISISDPVKTNITTSGGADGAISFSVTGGSGDYTYTWLKDGQAFTPPTGSTNTSLIGLQAGIYDLTVSDSANINCSITLTPSISLTQPGPLSIDSLIPTPILCKGEATGSITAAVTGTAPFSYVWERVDGQAITSVNNATIAGLSAGEYRLRLTDDSTNPEITDTIIIEEPALDLTATNIPTDSSCFGAIDGTIVINASGGTAGYFYSLDGVTFQANNTFSNLIADTYTITVRDANDCAFQTTGTVGEPNEIIVTNQITNTTLNGASDGAISINIAGGTPLFETLWSGPNGFTSTLEDINNLTAGVYTLEVRDANHTIDASGCYFTQDYTVTEPAALIITNIVTTDTNCFDEANGSITTTVSGEGTITYEWTLADGSPVPVSNGTNAEDITGIIAGGYILTVTDDNISVTSPIITINGPTIALTIQNTNGINSTCNGEDNGSIEVFASGGTAPYQYSINGVDFQNSPTFTNLAPGQYTITVLDNNNCTDVQPTPVLITQPVALNFIINEQRALSAANASDGVIAITPSGGSGDYTYSWTGPNFTSTDRDIFGLDSGDYFLTLTDATNTNCMLISAAITIAEPGVLIVTTTQTELLECNGDDSGEITANVQGGVPPFTYEWFEVINGNNNLLTEDTEIISNLTAGTYFVRVTDANDIVAVAVNPTIINEPELLRIVIDNTTDVLCNGEATGAISISVTGGTQPYRYFWSNGDTVEDINNLSAGEYSIEVIDVNECIAEENISISAPTNVVQIANAIVTDVTAFQGSDGSIELDIIGGTAPYTIVWARNSDNANVGNQATISNLTADSYAVSITDANGCSINANYEITQPDIVEETIVPPTCTGESNGSITVLVNEGNGTFIYDWNTGATTNSITNLPADTYSVTITGFEDGPITRTYELIDPLPLEVNLGTDRVLCADQILNLDATVADETASYLWSSNTGFTSTSPNVTLIESGDYTVVVTSETGCTAQGNISVDISTDEIDAEFAISSQVFEGEEVLAVDISFPLPETIVWQVPEGATIITQNSDELVLVFETEGEYEIGITTTRGDCIATKTKKVLVVKRDPLTEQDEIRTENIVEDFIVYPNPTTGKFTADVSISEPGNISIKIFNFANNALIASERGRAETSYSIPFDISGMPAGVYAVLLETPYGTSIRKIVVR